MIPEKPCSPREAAEKIPRAHETGEEVEDERTKADKGDDERSKGSYSGKPARAVGVAHPFNAEKSEGEFALGMVGSITTGILLRSYCHAGILRHVPVVFLWEDKNCEYKV